MCAGIIHWYFICCYYLLQFIILYLSKNRPKNAKRREHRKTYPNLPQHIQHYTTLPNILAISVYVYEAAAFFINVSLYMFIAQLCNFAFLYDPL